MNTPAAVMATAATMRTGQSWSHGQDATGCSSIHAATRTPTSVVISVNGATPSTVPTRKGVNETRETPSPH